MNNLKMFGTRRRKESSGINISPLVDMVFLLLIFFLVTTTFSPETGVDIQKPKAGSAQSLTKENIMIAVAKDGSVHIDNKEVDMESLNSVIKRFIDNNKNLSVIIIADKDSHTGRVIEVMDVCKLAGIERISIAAIRDDN